MKEKGMGRTRLGRFAAITVPATVATAGLGFAVVTGLVSANLASATSFDIAGDAATGDALELTANYTEGATTDTDASVQNKNAALVSLKNGAVQNLCLAADTAVPVVGTLGLKIESTGNVSLGPGWTDLAAVSLQSDEATLGTTAIGYAQTELDHQPTLGASNFGYAEGGFSLATQEAAGAVDLDGLDASVYALTLDGLNLANLNIALSTTPVEGTC